MSTSKFDIGGGLFPSKSKADKGQLQSNSLTSGLTKPSLLDTLTPNSSSSSSSPLQVGDLLPTQSDRGFSSLGAGLQGQPALAPIQPILEPVQPALSPAQPAVISLQEEDQSVVEATHVLHLSSVGRNKIQVIKAIRAHWDLGLKDSKELSDSTPIDLPALPEAQARAAEVELSALGASVSLDRC